MDAARQLADLSLDSKVHAYNEDCDCNICCTLYSYKKYAALSYLERLKYDVDFAHFMSLK